MDQVAGEHHGVKLGSLQLLLHDMTIHILYDQMITAMLTQLKAETSHFVQCHRTGCPVVMSQWRWKLMRMNVSCGKTMWHDDKYLSVITLSLHLPINVQTLAESKFPLSGLVDWVLLDFSHTYCDVFTVMTSSLLVCETTRPI